MTESLTARQPAERLEEDDIFLKMKGMVLRCCANR